VFKDRILGNVFGTYCVEHAEKCSCRTCPFLLFVVSSLKKSLPPPCSKYMDWVQDYPVRAQLYPRLLEQPAGISFILFVLLFRGEAEFTRDGNITSTYM